VDALLDTFGGDQPGSRPGALARTARLALIAGLSFRKFRSWCPAALVAFDYPMETGAGIAGRMRR